MKKSFHPIHNFLYALKGIKHFLFNEMTAGIMSLISIVVIGAGFYFHVSKFEWIALLMCISGVLVAEMFNTAIEKMVDKISPERNEVAGKIKDISAGAVLLASLFAGVAGAIIFLPKVLVLLNVSLK